MHGHSAEEEKNTLNDGEVWHTGYEISQQNKNLSKRVVMITQWLNMTLLVFSKTHKITLIYVLQLSRPRKTGDNADQELKKIIRLQIS